MGRQRGTTTVLEVERPLFCQLVRQVVRLRSEQLEDSLELQRRVGGRLSLGQILLCQGLITRQQIREVLRLQAAWVAAAAQADFWPRRLPCDTCLSLCLPAFNEQDNIQDTLDAACAILPEFVQRFEVIVVDDGSRDATGALVAAYARHEPRVRLVAHEQNRGYGAAVSSGLRAARGDLVAFTDADGQFSLLDLPQLLRHADECAVVVGYRYRRADPWHRRMNAWAWNRLVRLALGVQVRDLDCAFKLFRREVVDQLQLTAQGAAINAEIMAQCVRGGWAVRETPVTHYPRCNGSPTGAALRVITRAFRELPRLLKYRWAPVPTAAPAPCVPEAAPAVATPAPPIAAPALRGRATQRLPILAARARSRTTQRMPVLRRHKHTYRLPVLRIDGNTQPPVGGRSHNHVATLWPPSPALWSAADDHLED